MSDHPDLAQTANLAMSAAQALSGFAAVHAGDPAVPRELAPADAIGKLREALEDLARALASPGAAESFPKAAPLLPNAASQISFAALTLEAAERVEASGRYVVARIKKAYEPGGEHPGPQHVGKTFVPHDDSTLTKEAAEASARSSNAGYRYGPDGKTFIAVRAEPIPGTNKFRNLDHPSLAGEAKVPTGARRDSRPSLPPPASTQGDQPLRGAASSGRQSLSAPGAAGEITGRDAPESPGAPAARQGGSRRRAAVSGVPPSARHGRPDPVDFPDKVRPAAARGLAGGGHPPGPRARRQTPPKGGRTP